MIHELKIEHTWAVRLRDGDKTAEVRKHDRDYQAGDTVTFHCNAWAHGSNCTCVLGFYWTITHVLTAVDGLNPAFCVLSLRAES